MLKPTSHVRSFSVNLYRSGAISAFGMALCYMFLFIVFGALLSVPQTEHISHKIQFIAEHYFLISSAYFVGYILFGTLLLVAVQATHHRLQRDSSTLLNTASAFGLIWTVLMMCAGLIALVGTYKVVGLFEQGSEHTVALFYACSIIADALGGGIEIVGGVWVLLLSFVGLRTQQLHKALHILGMFVGGLGVLTVVQSIPELKDAFGLSQIIWFIGLSWALKTSTIVNQTDNH